MIQRYSIEPVYLAVHSAMVDYLLKHGVRDNQIVTLSDNIGFGVWKKAAVDYDFLSGVEHDYGMPNLYFYREGIRTYEGYSHYDELKILEVSCPLFWRQTQDHGPEASALKKSFIQESCS